MDTTEIYIKQVDCPEVQELRPDDCEVDSVNMPWWDYQGNCWFNQNNERIIWLPRQDQLQEMICEHINGDWLTALYWLNRFSGGEGLIDGTLRNVFSMEQLWLAFMMFEKFGKTWDKTQWQIRISA